MASVRALPLLRIKPVIVTQIANRSDPIQQCLRPLWRCTRIPRGQRGGKVGVFLNAQHPNVAHA